MRNAIKWAVFGMVFCGLAAPLGAQDKKPEAGGGEMVANPLYKHWTNFKPGSFSKIKMTSDAGGMKSEMVMTQTLKEVTPEKVVVEILTVTMVNGQEMKMPPQPQELPAKVSKADADKIDNPEGKVKEGTEDVEAAGKKHKTKWFETQTKVGEMTIKAKIWLCEDVPGQLVKMTSDADGQMKMTSEGALVEFKADKK